MVVHLLHTEQGAGSNPAVTTKFCKGQQEKDSLGRFFEGQPSAKVGRVRVP